MSARSVVALLLATAGCSLGPSPAQLRDHLRPGGARLSVDVTGAVLRGSVRFASPRLVGELVAVGDRALLLLVPTGQGDDAALVEVDTAVIRHIDVEDPPVEVDEERGGWLERLRPLARHPDGLAPEGLERLLRSLGQESLVRVLP